MPAQNLPHQSDTLDHCHIRQPDQTCVSNAVQEDELAEVRVDGHHHSPLGDREFKERPVARICTEFFNE